MPNITFKTALTAENPLQIIGTINAYCAKMAEKVGYRAIYLSGGGCANASYGVPDIGITTLENVCEDVRRIAHASSLPLLVDMDTGWDNPEKAVRELCRAGAAAAHLEDQVSQKRCGHLEGKKIVRMSEMTARIEAAISGKTKDFYLIARTDAMAIEGMDGVIDRAKAYLKAGADAIFAEAFASLDDYKKLIDAIGAPVLANITEFGKTPLFTLDELKSAGVQMVLYPLSAFRAMNQAAFDVFSVIREKGTQQSVINQMQDRRMLYAFLEYSDQ